MPAQRVQGFGSSIIREMTRLSLTYDALNLSQGFPDFPAPEAVTRAAVEAIESHVNQYTVTWGIPALREAVMSDDLKEKLAKDGAEPLPSTPEEYAADIDREETKWSAIVKKSGASAQ